ncbi:GNAT family N-acetyltransferase [Fictibacillus nanhaiensis]|uniref:GNAT family N-acetyltransferase n=1 Tax=Fictibacillus nanhaiensis TaxID=742169 RepID=UPI001C989978|nr:GNAT family N-acetyltransferase [Fictibacillus nanhaiensis]MBY6037663.1 GNAT family N-acetyltransferase [Fictibacillus nanhaiensis]
MNIFRTKDYETIAKLNKTVQDLHVELFPESFTPYHYESIRDFYKGIVDDQRHIFLLVEQDTLPVGYVWMTIRESGDTPFKRAAKSLYIHQISVDETVSNQGIGTKLIDYIEQMAKEISATKIELDYWVDNTIARTFYQKRGFVIYREVVHKEFS